MIFLSLQWLGGEGGQEWENDSYSLSCVETRRVNDDIESGKKSGKQQEGLREGKW